MKGDFWKYLLCSVSYILFEFLYSKFTNNPEIDYFHIFFVLGVFTYIYIRDRKRQE